MENKGEFPVSETRKDIQSNESKLMEHLTGIPLEKETALTERIYADQSVFRKKYNLPDYSERINNPLSYVKKIEEIAKENKIIIYNEPSMFTYVKNILKIDLREPFTDNPLVTGYHTRSEGIVINPENTKGITWGGSGTASADKIIEYGYTIEHELIHRLQPKDMPSEVKEYEAYIAAAAGLEPKIPNIIKNIINGINHSTLSFYKENNLNPKWL